MQRLILSKKNHIALISAILIVIGFTSELGFKNEAMAIWSLVIASILGVAPIAIQAYQALKVKVVSIDVLVTIAVIGAFFIKNFEESAIVTFLFLSGAFLEQRTLNKTRSAIKELTEMAPESALKQMENGEFEEVEVDEVDVGDILLVKTGAKVPVDDVKPQGCARSFFLALCLAKRQDHMKMTTWEVDLVITGALHENTSAMRFDDSF